VLVYIQSDNDDTELLGVAADSSPPKSGGMGQGAHFRISDLNVSDSEESSGVSLCDETFKLSSCK